MKIKYQGTEKYSFLREYFNIYIGINEEVSDYYLAVTLFGREFLWFIYK